MRKGWERKRIAEIAQHSLGKMLDKAKNRGEPQPYLRNLNVRWFDFDLSDLLEMRFLPEEQERYTVRKGDLVICEGGYPGRAAIWESDDPIYFQKALHRVRFHEPVHAKWCLYYLHFRDLEGTLSKHFNGAGIQHFTGEALSRFELYLPPLADQRRIVKILDEAFASIAAAKAHAEQNRQNARALFESHLHAVFAGGGTDWTEATVGELVTRGVLHAPIDGNHGEIHPKKADFVESGVPFLMASDLKGGVVDLENCTFIPRRLADNLRKGFAKNGDVLLSHKGTIGRVAILTTDLDYVVLTPQVTYYRVAEPSVLLNHFLSYALQSPAFVTAMNEIAEAGSTRAYIGITKQHELPLAFPPIDQQKKLAATLDALSAETRRLEALYTQKLAALDELKASLLRQAFSGQL
jgi:restriction endonuclease S subunit